MELQSGQFRRIRTWRSTPLTVKTASGEVKDVIPTPANSNRSNRWTRGQTSLAISNVAAGWELATPEQKESGAQFFPTWNQDAMYIGNRIREAGLAHPDAHDVHIGAAMLSHLSPKNEAEKNRIQGYELMVHLAEHGPDPFERHNQPLSDALDKRNKLQDILTTGLKNRSIKRGSSDHLELQRLIDQHQATVTHHRLKMGTAYVDEEGEVRKTPLADVGTRELMSAVRSIGHSEPLITLGRVKRRDFGENISDPEGYTGIEGRTGHTVDTHLHDLIIGQTTLPYSHNRGLDAINRYATMGNVVERARQIVASGVGRSAFMAGAWVGHLHRKIAASPSAAQARGASGTQLNRIVNTEQFIPFLPKTHGQRATTVQFGAT